jgi:hypothetical protein
MSGSLLWDRKFVARTTSGYQWSVDDAQVCGLIWATHEKLEIVVATKIEYVLPTLNTQNSLANGLVTPINTRVTPVKDDMPPLSLSIDSQT